MSVLAVHVLMEAILIKHGGHTINRVGGAWQKADRAEWELEGVRVGNGGVKMTSIAYV